ncbi:hypothetical protein BC830DRAFT_1223523 [Chytriomyces sp. MP71]|nr:hypothetical protein BC830DRAFT_1223523 [Chytriomyces sp. MP71]
MLFTFGISAGTSVPWSSPEVIATIVVSFVGLVLFVCWERRVAYPLIPRGFFNKQTSLILVMTFLVLFAFYGSVIFSNLSLQNVYQYSTVLTAVHLLPKMVVGFLTSSAIGYLVTRYPRPLPFLLFGHAAMMTACALFAFVTVRVSYWALAFPALCCIVLGYDVIYNLFNILIMTSCAVENRGFAGGAGIGITVEYTVADAVTAAHGVCLDAVDALSKGYDLTLWIGARALGLSALIAVANCERCMGRRGRTESFWFKA